MKLVDAGLTPLRCQCGTITHAIIESDGVGSATELEAIVCWRCSSVIAQISGVTVWTGETEEDALEGQRATYHRQRLR